ncbi:MAG: glycosyltransferase family 39 protein [bacterium]
MNKIIIGVLVLVGWIIGQVMIFLGHVAPGISIILLSVLIGLLILFKPWQLLKNTSEVRSSGINLNSTWVPVFLASAGFILSIIGTIIVKDYSNISLFLYIGSGFLLFLAKPINEKFFQYFEIPEKSQPMQKWEPWFVLALFSISVWLRFYNLGDLPAVGGGNEGLILGNSRLLSTNGMPYMPHIGGGTDWPTFTYYVGIFFANIFGWDISTFRFSNGIFGVISIISFYFLTRRITSPLSAAITSLMYSVFLAHLIISRLFVPVVTLLFIPHILCLAIILAASKRPKWYLYLAAGLACGFSLEGYVPGRGVILLFVGWFIIMFITRQKMFHKISNFILFWVGFLLVASPVIYFAITKPDQYWGYVNSVNPSRGGSILTYIQLLWSRVPLFAGMLYTKSASEILWHLPYEPLLNPITIVLFSAGLFLSFFAFWKPIPAALLILFFGGMMPSMLGGGGPSQPNSARAIMAFPIIFILSAFSFERLIRVFYQLGKKKFYIFILAIGIICSLWTFQSSFKDFLRWSTNPILLVMENHQFYLMGKEIKKYPKAVFYVSPLFIFSDAAGVYLPKNIQLNVKKNIDDMMVFPVQNDYVLLIDPFYTDAVSIYSKYFPNAIVKTYSETDPKGNDEYFETIKMNSNARRYVDKFVPYVFLSSVFIPKQDIVDFQTMLYVMDNSKFERVRVFGKSDFSKKYSNKKIRIKGALLVPPLSVADSNNQELCIFNLPWSGWKLMVDGKERQFGNRMLLDSGIHFIEFSGTVPLNAVGDLPLDVRQGTISMVERGLMVGINEKFGVRMYESPGANNWDKPFTYSHRQVGPDWKIYDGMSMQLPFSLKVVSYMRVPVDGEYEISGNKYNRCKILVNGIMVFENMSDPVSIISKNIFLTKDKPAKIELFQLVEGVPISSRALTVYVKSPNMDVPIIAPYDWFYPVD